MRSIPGIACVAGLAVSLVVGGCSDEDDDDPGVHPPSAKLVDLTVSAGTVYPVFSPDTILYAVGPCILPPSVTVTPTAADPGATIEVNGTAVASGTPSTPIDLSLGVNFVTIVVTATDGTTQKDYMVLPLRGGPAEQEAYLKAHNTDSDDNFGWSVAIDGDTIVVGARNEGSLDTGTTTTGADGADNDGAYSGAAYVFVRSGGDWTQEAYLKAHNTDGGDCFGWSVAIDGDTIVVGAYLEESLDTGTTTTGADGADNDSALCGAAYVFVRSGSDWTQESYLKAHNTAPFDCFGSSVAIDGDTIVVGADRFGSGSGGAYVFVRSGSDWTQESYLEAHNPGSFDFFARSVAIDGDTIVVGALGEESLDTGTTTTGADGADNDGAGCGAAYVFVRSGSDWTQESYLKAHNTDSGDCFGSGVAIDGDTIVVGASGEESLDTGTTTTGADGADNDGAGCGAAYVFVRSGSDWTQESYLKAHNTDSGDCFGSGVAIDGDTIVVGASGEESLDTGTTTTGADGADNDGAGCGAAYVFVRSGSDWTQESYLKAHNTDSSDYFGSGVAIDGDTVVVGVYFEDSLDTGTTTTGADGADNDGADCGAAYVLK